MEQIYCSWLSQVKDFRNIASEIYVDNKYTTYIQYKDDKNRSKKTTR